MLVSYYYYVRKMPSNGVKTIRELLYWEEYMPS
jgi:hypothetical protein